MPTATANGKKFKFPEGTTPEQMGEAIDSYFANAPAAPAPAPAAPVDYSAQAAKDTLASMSGPEKFLAGMGSSVEDLLQGAAQLYGGLGESESTQEALRQQAAENQQYSKPLTSTGAGMAGELAGNVAMTVVPGGVAAKAARFGLPAAMAAEGLVGGGMGALAPTTEEGQRAENVAWGAGLGAAIPAAGAATRKLVGQADPAMVKAAETLKRYGIKTSKADQAPGLLSKGSEFVLENAPVSSQILKAKSASKNKQVADALFDMLGTKAPSTNDEMTTIVKKIGDEIGSASVGKKVAVQEIKSGVDDVMKEYNKLLPAQRSKRITEYGKQLSQLSSMKGAKLKGEAYQAIRSDMATEAASAAPADAKALRGMVKVLDDQFAKALTPKEQAAQKLAKERYRLAKALQKVDIKEGGIDVSKARAAIERTAKKGEVMPQARELLDAADLAIPKVKGNLITSGPAGAVAAVLNPAIALKIAGLGAVPRAILATGAPQAAAASPFLRKATAAALRGVNQEIVDED